MFPFSRVTELRDLLQLCDLYELLELKEACGESIVVNMTAENLLRASALLVVTGETLQIFFNLFPDVLEIS